MKSNRQKKILEIISRYHIETQDDLIERLHAIHVDLDIKHTALTEENIALCHEKGFKVNAWTVDDKERAEQLAAWGIDMITSNILE